MQQLRANLIGISALLLWASTALLVVLSKEFHVWFLLSYTCLIGYGFFNLVWIIRKEDFKSYFAYPLRIMLLAILGIGGYRIFFYLAFETGVAIEVNLVNYLWPILVVVFAGFLPDEKLRLQHILGALTGFAGLFFLLQSKGGNFFEIEWGVGHFLALIAAIIWGIFSVISRHTKGYSSNVVPASFLVTGLLFLILYFMVFYEDADFSRIELQHWFFATLLGIIAAVGYYFWDIGMKHGNIQFLGVASYFTPVLSTLFLYVFGQGELTPNIVLAAALIFLGSVIASIEKLQKLIQKFRQK